MSLRYSLPLAKGTGAGLGNEVITWARAFLIAQVLGISCLPPAFGRNSRRYWRHFGTPKYDWLLQKIMSKTMPVIKFSETDYLSFGGGDVVEAFRAFAIANHLFERKTYLLTTDGMWGGYYHIRQARDFVFATLYNSHFAAKNLLQIQQRLSPNKLTVGMHVRLGDFAQSLEPAAYRGKFNIALPLSWYINIGKQIQLRYGDGVQFLIASDGTPEQLKPLTDSFNCVLTTDIKDSDCSDILALSKTDLLVCSVSSFSAISAFLSDAPYLWFEPQLQIHQEGYYSIWGHEPNQQIKNSPTLSAIERHSTHLATKPKGWPVGMNGEVSEEVFELINKRNLQNNTNYYSDLLMYGAVKIST